MRTPINALPGRYKPVVVNGHTQHMRDKVALKAEAVGLVRAKGPLTRTEIMIELRTVAHYTAAVLAEAAHEGEIEASEHEANAAVSMNSGAPLAQPQNVQTAHCAAPKSSKHFAGWH